MAVHAADKVGLPTDRVLVLGTVEPQQGQTSRIRPWTAIWASSEEARSWSWEKITTKKEAAATTAVINYSSGYFFFLSTNALLHAEAHMHRTTGFPKGVELTHYNILANAEQIIAKRLLVADTPSGRARRERLDTSSERWLAAVPMYHAFVRSTPRPYLTLRGSLKKTGKITGPILLLRDRPSARRESIYTAKVQLAAVSHIRRHLPNHIHQRRSRYARNALQG